MAENLGNYAILFEIPQECANRLQRGHRLFGRHGPGSATWSNESKISIQ